MAPATLFTARYPVRNKYDRERGSVSAHPSPSFQGRAPEKPPTRTLRNIRISDPSKLTGTAQKSPLLRGYTTEEATA